jgi:predicted site-specific integrase-resolvase
MPDKFYQLHFEDKLKQLSMTKAALCRAIDVHPNTASMWCRKGYAPAYAEQFLDLTYQNRQLKAALAYKEATEAS